jgi:hypothetical protein
MPSRDVDLEEAMKEALSRKIQQADEKQRRQITEPEESPEPNTWLCRMGWVEHSEGCDPEELRALVAPVKEDEPELEVLCKAFDWLIQDAYCTVIPLRSPGSRVRGIIRSESEGGGQRGPDAV